MQNIGENIYKKIQHNTKSNIINRFYRTFEVMRSHVNFHKTRKIISFSIIYIIIYNIIINQMEIHINNIFLVLDRKSK